jgi:hypothetical protein
MNAVLAVCVSGTAVLALVVDAAAVFVWLRKLHLK